VGWQIVLQDISGGVLSPVESDYDFIAAGYADGDLTNDIDKGKLWFELIDQATGSYATVDINGVPTLANEIFCRIYSADPTAPWRSYNGPSNSCVLTGRAFFTKPDGEDEAIDIWEESWR
jgi:hypothetical protein